MFWIVRILLAILLLVLAAALLFSVWKPWVPRLEMARPGETGQRVSARGMLANYFPAPQGGESPAILLLGGSDGGLSLSGRDMALSLQAEGFSVLQLAYFRGPRQPRQLELIPLETFFRGLDWLAARPEVDAGRLGIVGHSKGAEAALILSVRRPDIAAVAIGAPSSVAWCGINWARGGGSVKPSWSIGGAALPCLPYGRMDWRVGPGSVFTNGLLNIDQHPDTVIPVENGTAPALLICGEADRVWPSCTMAGQIAARAAANGAPPVTQLAYPEAGHFGFGVPVTEAEAAHARLNRFGGTLAGNLAARADSWHRLIDFLKDNLSSDQSG